MERRGKNLDEIDINYYMEKGNWNQTEADMDLHRTFSSLCSVLPHKLWI